MHRGLLLVVLLLLPGVPAQGEPPLAVGMDGFAFEYGPEAWKGGDPGAVEDQATFTQQTADWSASLGLRLEANLTVTPRSGASQEGWEYEATVSDGLTRVPGVVQEASAGSLRVWFDVDGQRALPGQAAVPALLPGGWSLRVDAYAPEGAGRESRGWGQEPLETLDVGFEAVRTGFNGPAVPGVAVPENLLPRIREVGPGPNTWLNAAPLDTRTVVAEVRASVPGQPIRWVAYQAVDVVPPLPDPGVGTPLEDLLPTPSPTLAWTRSEYGVVGAGDDGRLEVGLPVNATSGLHVFAAHGLRGGLAAFAVGVSPYAPRVDAWEAPEPGQEGDVQVGVFLPGTGAQQIAPGQAYALQQQVPGTAGQALGAQSLTQGPLVVDGDDHWRAVYDARPIRAAGISNYTFLAFLFDEQGAYRTHVSVARGADVVLDVPRLGVGHEAEIRVQLRNLADDGRAGPLPALGLPARIETAFDGRGIGNATVRVPEAGTLARAFAVTPGEDGAKEVEARMDTGDTVSTVRLVQTVLRDEDFRDRPWYDPEELIPAPPLPTGAALLLLAALALRHGGRRGPSQP